jgi:CheY-like chemotaxis protein
MESICLIAEGDPFIGRLLDRFAQKSGLKTIQAQAGQEVLDILQKNGPAVMILDPELPGITRGWEIMKTMQLDLNLAQIPVIACTWLNKGACISRFGEFNGYLQKPALQFEDFLQAITEAGIAVKTNLVPRD